MKAPEVKALVDLLEERLNNTNAALSRLEGECKGSVRAHSDLCRELDKSLPRMMEIVEELKRWRDEEVKEVETYVHLKRDVDELKKWKNERKEEEKELKKWYRSFGPGLLTLIITTLFNFVILAINLYFTYWIKKPGS